MHTGYLYNGLKFKRVSCITRIYIYNVLLQSILGYVRIYRHDIMYFIVHAKALLCYCNSVLPSSLRYDTREGDFPRILHQHAEEVRMLKSKIQKSRGASEGYKQQLVTVGLEVQRLTERNRKLESVNNKKNLEERNILSAQLECANGMLEEKEKRIAVSRTWYTFLIDWVMSAIVLVLTYVRIYTFIYTYVLTYNVHIYVYTYT